MKKLTFLVFCLALAACSEGEHEDLRRWMDENSKDLRPNIQKLPEVKPYEPVPYDEQNAIDPFKSSKIEPESKNKGAGKGGEDKVMQVKTGEYLGLDFGMVTKITDTEVKLRELIQDSAGDWSERESSLFLQNKEGSKK